MMDESKAIVPPELTRCPWCWQAAEELSMAREVGHAGIGMGRESGERAAQHLICADHHHRRPCMSSLTVGPRQTLCGLCGPSSPLSGPLPVANCKRSAAGDSLAGGCACLYSYEYSYGWMMDDGCIVGWVMHGGLNYPELHRIAPSFASPITPLWKGAAKLPPVCLVCVCFCRRAGYPRRRAAASVPLISLFLAVALPDAAASALAWRKPPAATTNQRPTADDRPLRLRSARFLLEHAGGVAPRRQAGRSSTGYSPLECSLCSSRGADCDTSTLPLGSKQLPHSLDYLAREPHSP